MYSLLRDVFFLFPPEDVHEFSMHSMRRAYKVGFIRNVLTKKFGCGKYALPVAAFGLNFRHPVGLGAGFDKNAQFLNELAMLGFSHVEIGTVTPKPQPGNDKPRVFRLPQDKALINRMGFNNNGANAIRGRLENWRTGRSDVAASLIVGGNIGKNKVTDNEDAWKDYERCFRELHEVVDYFTVNVSSPNTPGLRALQDKDALYKILSNLQEVNKGRNIPKPLLLKIAPDLGVEQLDDIVALAFQVKLDGLVISNTTLSREGLKTTDSKVVNETGGLSGAPLLQRSNEVLRYISSKTEGRIPLIASGGINTGEQAAAKLKLGASLVQVWTGFIYEGPAIATRICSYLQTTAKG